MHQFYSLCSQLIGGIVVCLLIISFSVTLTLNFRPLYYADIQNLHITELSGREEKDIRSNYDALIDYNSLFNHQPLKFPTCAMSESGRIHFEEVKKIFDFFGWLFVGTLLLTAAAAFYFIKKHAWLRPQYKKVKVNLRRCLYECDLSCARCWWLLYGNAEPGPGFPSCPAGSCGIRPDGSGIFYLGWPVPDAPVLSGRIHGFQVVINYTNYHQKPAEIFV